MSNVKPVLIKWAEEDESDIGSDASTSSILSRDIIEGVEMDHLPTREVHVLEMCPNKLDHYNRFFPSFPNPDQGNIYLL
jgi:hypothetical protein